MRLTPQPCTEKLGDRGGFLMDIAQGVSLQISKRGLALGQPGNTEIQEMARNWTVQSPFLTDRMSTSFKRRNNHTPGASLPTAMRLRNMSLLAWLILTIFDSGTRGRLGRWVPAAVFRGLARAAQWPRFPWMSKWACVTAHPKIHSKPKIAPCINKSDL